MLTTTDYFAFMNALDPGDLLVFGGTDPMDRLLQWIDGSSYNHVGVWLGSVADEADGGADGADGALADTNLTIHAGLNSLNLTAAERLNLFGPDGSSGLARRHGTVWLIPLDLLLDPLGLQEVGGSLQFDLVTALRWNRPEALDVQAVLAELTGKMDPGRTPLRFDFGQLGELAEFWIRRAYRRPGENQALADVTISLFDGMKGTIQDHAAAIEAGWPTGDAEKTTCSRFVYDAFDAAGQTVDIPIPTLPRPGAVEEAGPVRKWVTPSDYLRSPDFTAFAQWTKAPDPPPLG